MNGPLIGFLVSLAVILGVIGYFLRGVLWSISTLAAQHAATFSVAYVKGGALMFIAASTAFGSGYNSLDAAMKASMPWAPYVIFFCLPLSAGLSVLVAFLDRSGQRASEEQAAKKAATNPPFPVAPVKPLP